jgi:type IV secretion system protein VirD4
MKLTTDRVIRLFQPMKDPEGLTKIILYLCGFILGPITLVGAIWGYIRAYNRYFRHEGSPPVLHPLEGIQKVSMVIFAIVIWLLITLVMAIVIRFFDSILDLDLMQTIYLVGGNGVITILVMWWFSKWRDRVGAEVLETTRFGTARFASEDDVKDLRSPNGLYIGGGNFYSKQGHILTVAGTRGGKGTNLIIPNLLGIGQYKGSWVVIDPKGENAAITGRYQASLGQTVLVLDPWKLNGESVNTYNPLDLVRGSKNLADDAGIIAEMIVPEEDKGDRFFNDRARSLITAMIVYMMETEGPDELTEIWTWLRMKKDAWVELLADMSVSDNPIVSGAANEMLNMMETSERTYGSVIATAQQNTDFLKSPAIQESMKKSNFNINSLSEGNTTLYVIIPADKIKSQSQWLRLIVTTSLRAVIRNKKNRVTFLLDEFAALGYLPEIETALSTYAGYNVTIWAILQSLIQLSDKYGKNWETFLGNTAIKHFFSLGDNFTSDYVSKIFGTKTFVGGSSTTSRPLITQDELRRASSDFIFTVVEQRPPMFFAKKPYYEIPGLQGRFDKNPYFG